MATITASCKVGDLTIQVAAEHQRDLIEQMSFWTQLPTECPLCGASVYLFHRQPQGYDYYGLKCVGQEGDGTNAHECNFGIYREGNGTLFYKADSWQDAWTPQGGGYDDDGGEGMDDSDAPPERASDRRQPQQQQGFHGQRSGQPAGQPAQSQSREERERRVGAATFGQRADQQDPRPAMVCSVPGCGKPLNKGQHDVSMRAFGAPMCPGCQRQQARAA